MGIQEIIDEKVQVIKKIRDILTRDLFSDFNKEEKEELLLKLGFIDSNLTDLLKNYEEAKNGQHMFILTCLNNFDYYNRTLKSLVKNLGNKWNKTLEPLRLELLKLNKKSRYLLVDFHNKTLLNNDPENRILQEDDSKNFIEDLVENYYSWELFDLLKEKISQLEITDLKSQEKEAYVQLSALMEAKFGDMNKAIKILEEEVNNYPKSFGIFWNLALLLEKQCKMDKAKQYFKKILKINNSIYTFLMVSRLYYLWDFYREGLEISQNLLEIYHNLKIVDDHFLLTRGYPSYKEVFANFTIFSLAIEKPNLAKKKLEYAKQNLTDFPFERLEPTLKAITSENWDQVFQDLEKEKQEIKKFNGTTEVQDIHQALIMSRKEKTYEEAINHLNSIDIKLDENNWLNHLILFGKAEAANKHKNKQEKQLQEKFLKKQPLLFEPHHIFNFGLFEYQEKLKKKYKKTKKETNKGTTITYHYN
ncbi:MAG: tetratricopeptide repeat protein [Candidatus Ranarchaeia archaeon]